MTDGGYQGMVVAGRYRLVAELGAGGFGRVWRAWDESLRLEVALKAVRLPSARSEKECADLAVRAVREVRNAARLRTHPSVVAVHDVVTDGGVPWIVMELVEGRSLQDELRATGRLPADRVCEVARAVLSGFDLVRRGYDRAQVDGFLALPPHRRPSKPRFDRARRGYHIAQVDEAVRRCGVPTWGVDASQPRQREVALTVTNALWTWVHVSLDDVPLGMVFGRRSRTFTVGPADADRSVTVAWLARSGLVKGIERLDRALDSVHLTVAKQSGERRLCVRRRTW